MKGKELLKFHEGVRLKAYKDTLGNWTIGVGHLLPDPKNDAKWQGYRISKAECDRLFEKDWLHHIHLVETQAPWAMLLDEVRRYVIVDMTFNLGIEPFDGDGFKDWPIFVRQLKEAKWPEAAANMRSTRWARQVKSRAVRLAEMMETGAWPREDGVPEIV